MLRISDPLYSLIALDSRAKGPLRQSTDSRGCVQPRAQGLVADGVVQLREIHDDRPSGVPAVADAGEDDDFAGMRGAP